MSFGLSGDGTRSKMIGGDVVVAWVDKATLKGYAVDYFLDAKSQCAGTRGSCPDERLRVTFLLNGNTLALDMSEKESSYQPLTDPTICGISVMENMNSRL